MYSSKSIRKSTMILASAFNNAGTLISEKVLSKAMLNQHRQCYRQQTVALVKEDYIPSKSIVTNNMDRLPDLLSSLVDSITKPLGVSNLASGSDQSSLHSCRSIHGM